MTGTFRNTETDAPKEIARKIAGAGENKRGGGNREYKLSTSAGREEKQDSQNV
jgi:hypothetical protein